MRQLATLIFSNPSPPTNLLFLLQGTKDGILDLLVFESFGNRLLQIKMCFSERTKIQIHISTSLPHSNTPSECGGSTACASYLHETTSSPTIIQNVVGEQTYMETHAPITPNFPSNSNREIVGDHVREQVLARHFSHYIIVGDADGWCLNQPA